MKIMMRMIGVLVTGAILATTGVQAQENRQKKSEPTTKLFLAGDVMSGRGIDQAFSTSVDPVLYESYVKDARDYLLLAERENGEIPTPLSYDYVWGKAMDVWRKEQPVLKLVNLETSITTHDIPWPRKGIHYRMHPENVELLTRAGIDHISLANNHVLDWSRPGLLETLNVLKNAGISFSGAGVNKQEAKEPSVFELDGNRLLVFSYALPTSGVPEAWAATTDLSGLNYLPNLSENSLKQVKQNILEHSAKGDLVVFSVHWGGNWGYEVEKEQRAFAKSLIDEAGVDVVFGHSSHHPMGMEVHNQKLIIYGAGDFLNDYEGISGHQKYRPELTLMYFPVLNTKDGSLNSLKMVPMKIEKFHLQPASAKEAKWLEEKLSEESEKLGAQLRRDKENVLWLEW